MNYMVGTYVLANAKAVTQSGTSYSDSYVFNRCTGFAGVLVTSTAGSITVTQQGSLDDVTYYDAVDKSNNAIGAVAAAMTVGTRFVQFDPVLAPYMRFKIVEGGSGATAVTLTFIQQE